MLKRFSEEQTTKNLLFRQAKLLKTSSQQATSKLIQQDVKCSERTNASDLRAWNSAYSNFWSTIQVKHIRETKSFNTYGLIRRITESTQELLTYTFQDYVQNSKQIPQTQNLFLRLAVSVICSKELRKQYLKIQKPAQSSGLFVLENVDLRQVKTKPRFLFFLYFLFANALETSGFP